MGDEFVSIPAVDDELVPVLPSDLTIEKSREVANTLLSGGMNFVQLVECYGYRSSSNGEDEIVAETIVFDTEVELPQHPQYPIAKIERIAVTFERKDTRFPRVYALRKEFPLVPHLNLESFEFPRSLCLFELPYNEVKLQWTAVSFIERIRNWLADTASGDLHKSDQPLEPLLSDPDAYIIFPPKFLSSIKEDSIAQIRMVVDEWDNKRFCFVAENSLQPGRSKVPTFLVIGISGNVQQHGLIRSRPRDIPGLADFLKSADVNLIDDLRKRLSEAVSGITATVSEHLQLGLIVLVSLPKTRKDGGAVEANDMYAFVCVRKEESNGRIFCTVAEIGEQIGLWQIHEGRAGLNVPVDAGKTGSDVELWMLAPCYPLSRRNAPVLSGTDRRTDTKIVAVGLGALGSHIFLNLVRTGDGEWVTIDRDILLPHNFVRHAAYGSMAGLAKSLFATYVANSTVEDPPISKAIVADVLAPGIATEAVEAAFSEASVILDCSASRAVARHLALDVEAGARRISVFLNPTGNDVVILAEGQGRDTPLDSIEMQYYRLLASDGALKDHLRIPVEQARFSAACRDASNKILPELVARAAAIASSAFRAILTTNEAVIAIWRGNDAGEVRKISAKVGKCISVESGGWTIRTDEFVMEKIRGWREGKLPVETGGALIGSFDMQRRIIYVADALPAPDDSIEKRTFFVRGSFGLKPTIDAIEQTTLNNLQYVGEWHSHPAGHTAKPSEEDRKLLETITRLQHKDGNPGLMLICGDDRSTWHAA